MREMSEKIKTISDSPKIDSPLSPLVGSSPITGPSKGLHRYGFKVVRKRRATVQDTCSKHAGINSLACSSPIRKTPKRDGSLSRVGVRMDFAQPFPPREKRMTEQDYVLQVNNNSMTHSRVIIYESYRF